MQVKNGKVKQFQDITEGQFGERLEWFHSSTKYLVIYSMPFRFFKNSLATIPDYDVWKPRRQIYDHSFNKRYLAEHVWCTDLIYM